MNDDEARTIIERAKAAVERPCFTSVTPRRLRLIEGDWLRLDSIWTAENAKAWSVWYQPETDDGRHWPLIVTQDGVIPRKFEPQPTT